MNTTHDLTYRGLVDPAAGTLMGPGMDGRTWRVLGSMHDPSADLTIVTVEQVSA